MPQKWIEALGQVKNGIFLSPNIYHKEKIYRICQNAGLNPIDLDTGPNHTTVGPEDSQNEPMTMIISDRDDISLFKDSAFPLVILAQDEGLRINNDIPAVILNPDDAELTSKLVAILGLIWNEQTARLVLSIDDFWKKQVKLQKRKFEIDENVKQRLYALYEERGEGQYDIWEIILSYFDSSENLQPISKYQLQTCQSATRDFQYNLNDSLVPLYYYSMFHGLCLVIVKIKDGREGKAWAELMSLLIFIQNSSNISENLSLEDYLLTSYVFNAIPYPLVLIDKEKEILSYNSEFTKMGILPGELAEFQNKEFYESERDLYRITRIPLSDLSDESLRGIDLLAFVKEKSEVPRRSGGDGEANDGQLRDLGIMASSLAHELNNPIGGILSAVQFLLLETRKAGDEEGVMLEEMKNCAGRCRDLVHLFLGFTRVQIPDTSQGSCSLSLEQALNLLRSRMIELDHYFIFEYKQVPISFMVEINSSILAMVFYILLSEVLTRMHQKSLVEGSVKNKNCLISLATTHSSLILHMSNIEVSKVKFLADNKLFNHLVDLLKLDYEFDGKGSFILRSREKGK